MKAASNYLYEVVIGMIQDLNNGTLYRCSHMPRKHVFRITKIGKSENDGWNIVNELKHSLNTVYLKHPISDETFYSLPIYVYEKCVEIHDTNI